MTLAIILIAMICGTVAFLVIMLSGGHRDFAAQDRDRGLARLYEARADLMHVEELERRAVLRRQDEEERRIREARERRRHEAVCDEVRQDGGVL